MTTKEKNEGKTFADLLDSILSDRTRFLSFFGVLISFCVLFLLIFWIITKMLGVN